MKEPRGIVRVFVLGLLLLPLLACSRNTPTQVSPTLVLPTLSALPATLPAEEPPQVQTTTPTPSAVPPAPTLTAPVIGPGVTSVQFALDVDEKGELVFPADEFVYGVTRIYVRFAYQEFAEIKALQSRWYLNENPVSAGLLEWDGDASGVYILWLEDPNGLGRGQWRWQLSADTTVLGGGRFTIGGEPGYVNAEWAVAFDPPAGWTIETETAEFVTFSSADKRQGMALYAAQGVADLSSAAAANLAIFQQTHPEAEVLVSEETTMNGREALLQQVGYSDEEGVEQLLFVTTGVNAGSAYSLWVLGPAEAEAMLKTTLATTLYSIRFLSAE